MSESFKQQKTLAEQMSDLRRQIRRAEENNNEQTVLTLEAELRRLESGEAPKPTVSREKYTYSYFTEVNERHDIALFTKGVCEYVHQEKISNILFMDRSARPAWIAFHEYLTQVYPEEVKPGFYFINPDGFATDTSHTTGKSLFSLLEAAVTGESSQQPNLAAGSQFKSTYTKVYTDKDKPLLLFDTCAHTGNTLYNVKSVLSQTGFSDIRIVTASDPDKACRVSSELRFDQHKKSITCYPFGLWNNQIYKYDDTITSALDTTISKTRKGNTVRRELQEIVRESLKV